MSRLWNLNLILFFDFYLAVAFILGTWTRIRQYRTFLSLVSAFPGRWPRLLQLVKEHWSIFVTRSTIGPGVLAFGLYVIQLLASRLLWPDAIEPATGLTIERLLQHPWAVPFVTVFGLAMIAFDTWGIVVVGKIDRAEMEKYFDQAEYWLRSWTAPVVRVFTLGYINPRQMVSVEVRSALVSASKLLNYTLWWVSLQIGFRFGFGLSVWVTWALS
jgi:hypothetical protein